MIFYKDGTVDYTYEERCKLIDDIALNLGYEKWDDDCEDTWFKVYDEQSEFSPIMVIDVDLNAMLEFLGGDDTRLYCRFVEDDDGSDAEEFIELVRDANEQVIEDSHKIEQYINETLTKLNEEYTGKRMDKDNPFNERVLDTKKFYVMEDNFCEWKTKFTLKSRTYNGEKVYFIEKYVFWTDQANEDEYFDWNEYNTLEEAVEVFNSIEDSDDKRFRNKFVEDPYGLEIIIPNESYYRKEA